MSARLRALILGLAAGAVLLQGLLPAGYMLGARADLAAGSLLVPCPAQNELAPGAALAAHHQHHGGGAQPHPHSAGGHACAYALAAAAALPSAPAMQPEPLRALAFADDVSAARFRAAASLALPPPTGPPATS